MSPIQPWLNDEGASSRVSIPVAEGVPASGVGSSRRRWLPGVLLALAFLLNLITLSYTRELAREAFAGDPAIPLDWRVYQSAAEVVASHQSRHLYDGADTGADPQLKMSPPDTVLTRACQRLGLGERVGMYLYPPLLADLLVPLLPLPVQYEGYAWQAINVAVLLVTFGLAIQMAPLRRKWIAWLLLVLALPELRVVIDAVYTGQVSMLLTVLWVIGIYCYRRGWLYASALAMALATWLKLTPLLVVVPLLMWREWRWMRWFAVNLGLVLGALTAINGWHALVVCFTRVMPAMSRGVAVPWNRTFISYIQMLYYARHGVSAWDINYPPSGSPNAVMLAGKALSAVVLLAFLVVLYRRRLAMDRGARVAALLATALLSLVIAPVSWIHAYVILVPVLIVLWARAFREPQPVWGWCLLWVATVVLSGTLLDHVLARVHSFMAQTVMMGLHPVLQAALCFYLVYRGRASLQTES